MEQLKNNLESVNTSMQPPVSTSSPEPKGLRQSAQDQDSFVKNINQDFDKRMEDDALKR